MINSDNDNGPIHIGPKDKSSGNEEFADLFDAQETHTDSAPIEEEVHTEDPVENMDLEEEPLSDESPEEDETSRMEPKSHDGKMTAEEKKRERRRLSAKKTNYVFLFGYPGAGKSTIVASVIKYLRTCEYGTLTQSTERYTPVRYMGVQGNILVDDMLDRFGSEEFPLSTTQGEVSEIDIRFEHNNPKKKSLRLTFIETSGEDLKRVERVSKGLDKIGKIDKKDWGGKLPDFASKYFRVYDSTFYILVADSTNSRDQFDGGQDDDRLLSHFIDYLRKDTNNKKNIPNDKFMLLVSKWDKPRNTKYATSYERYEADHRKYVEKELKLTHHHAINTPFPMSYFSVGEVEEDPDGGSDAQIVNWDESRSEVLAKWLYEKATGDTLEDKPNWFQKIVETIKSMLN